MINMWLYGADGRALYYVSIPVPMPAVVTFAGMVFEWDKRMGRYEQTYPAPPYPGPFYSATRAPESENPPSD